MTQAIDLAQVVESRITEIIDQLQQDHPVFRDLDRTEQIREHADGLLAQWQPQEVLKPELNSKPRCKTWSF